MPGMATVVFFHAHPDDEAIATGGTMARLASDGHRVLCVTATKGELGEVEPGFLADGETLGDRRTEELHAACSALGVARGAFLGYRDSGMIGEPSNDDPDCFWQADVEEAAQRMADLLADETVDVLVTYDENGNYGHPDHIQVHRVGVRAAELLGVRRVYESTVDRDAITSMIETMRASDPDAPDPGVEIDSLGLPGSMITTRVDVRSQLGAKRAAMAAHASQISETSFFLSMTDEVFELAWGTEWYRRRDGHEGMQETSLLEGL